MKQYLHFVFDGFSSRNFNIVSGTTDSGLLEEMFVSSKEIKEQKIAGRTKPYFQGVEREAIEFPLTLIFNKGFTEEDLRKVKQWIDHDEYKELYFEEMEHRVVYAMIHSESNLTHTGHILNQGYIDVTVRCHDAFVYSPQYLDRVIDLSSNSVDGTIITFPNKSDMTLYPELFIEKIGSGDVSITNLSNGGEIFEIRNLQDLETVYVDNDGQDIESDLEVYGIYHYDDHNGIWLEMVYGVNTLNVKGNCKLQFRYQYKFK